MTNAEKLAHAVEAVEAKHALLNPRTGEMESVKVTIAEIPGRVIDATPRGRRAPGVTKADMIGKAYAERKDEMAREVDEDTERRPLIEVRLTKRGFAVTCLLTREDESTTRLEVDSISMRGAQREMTGYVKRLRFEPVGRWEQEFLGEDAPDDFEETFRTFRRVEAEDGE